MTFMLMIMSLLAHAEEPASPTAPAAAPPAAVVQIQADTDQRFSVIVNGSPLGVATHTAPLILKDMPAGPHSAEFRTEDNLVIWNRGVLTLQAGDQITLSLSEGRPVVPSGRTGAWRTTTSSGPLPQKPARTPQKEAP